MPQLRQVKLLDNCSINLVGILPTGNEPTYAFGKGPGAKPVAYAIDLRDTSAVGLFAKCVGGVTGLVFTTEVTNDPLGVDGWAATNNRLPGGAYAATARTVGPGTTASLFFDPTDSPCWVRLNVTTCDGVADAFLTTEQ